MSYFGYAGNNAANARLELENAKIALMSAGYTAQQINDAVLTQSTLRLEQLLSATGSNFVFPVLINDTGVSGLAVRKTEQRLLLQDAFYVSGFTVQLIKAASATDAALKPLTYPNVVTFPTGEAAALYAFYNGYLRVTVNNSVLIPYFPLTNFLNVPSTQLTGADDSPQDEFYGVERFASQPNPVFIGQKSTKVEIILPQAIGATLTANVYARIDFHGILAQNVTVVS